MSDFYDEWLRRLKATAKAGMCDRFPVDVGEAYLFTGRRRPQWIRRNHFNSSCGTWLEELREAVAAYRPEGILFRIRLSLTEDWPVPWSESVDRSEKDAAVICLLHGSLPRPLFWAAAVGESTYSVPALDDPAPNPQPFLQLDPWIEIDGSSVPEEYRTVMGGS